MSREIDLKWPLITINLVVAVDILGFMLILPIIDVFSQSLGASKQEIGLQLTLYAATSFISSFLVGKVSDRYGRKTVFIISAFGSFVTTLGCIFITTFTQFLVFSAFTGFFSGTIGTAYAYIGDIVFEEKRRSKYIAYITATISCCLVLGPLVGGLVASLWTLRAPFITGSVIACIEFFLVLRYLKNPSDLLKTKQIRLLAGDISSSYDYTHKDSFGSDDIKSNQIFNDLNYYHRTSFSEIILIDPEYTTGKEKEYKFKPPSRSSSKDQLAPAVITSPLPTVNTGSNAVASIIQKDRNTGDLEQFPPNASNVGENESLLTSHGTTTPPHTTERKKEITTPWKDYRAILIGGFGTFFNAFTYLGLVIIMPLILQEHKYGIVDDDNADNSNSNSNNDDDNSLSNHEINRITFLMGVFLCCYGVTQVLGMIFVFPRLNKKIGLFYCGFIGCMIYGIVYCCTLLIDNYNLFFIIYVGMAMGNSISRPVFPSYLGSIANRANRADYMAISASFGNIAIMVAGQMTVLYTIDKRICILLCGCVSIGNAFMILFFSCFHKVGN
jgi:MFS family permease